MSTHGDCPHNGSTFVLTGRQDAPNEWRRCGGRGWLCHACREDRADVRSLAAAMVGGSVGTIGNVLSAYATGPCNAVIVDRATALAAALRDERTKRGGEDATR